MPELSPEANRFLKEAVQDQNKGIIVIGTYDDVGNMFSICSNGRNFVEQGDAGSGVAWRSALDELYRNGFIRLLDKSGLLESYQLTREGVVRAGEP
jgi:hypothetical protein